MKRQIIGACLVGGLFFAGMRGAEPVQPVTPEVETVILRVGSERVEVPFSVIKESPILTNIFNYTITAPGEIPTVDLSAVIAGGYYSRFVNFFKRLIGFSTDASIGSVIDLMTRYYNTVARTPSDEIPDLTNILGEAGIVQRDAVPLIKVFHFLQVKPLVALLMFTYGKKVYEKNEDRIVAEHFKVAGLSELIQADIDKMAFSVRELVELGQVPRPMAVENGILLLDLSYKKIASLDGLQTIKELRNVNALSLYNNQLSSLSEGIFQGLERLESIDLSYNQLRMLSGVIFQGVRRLKQVNFSHNQLGSLPEEIFQGLQEVKVFVFSHNQLSNLPEGIFQGMRYLEKLDFSYNQLSGLPEKIFRDLRVLEWLRLSYNQLSSLPEGIFQGLGGLFYLDLSHNQLSSLLEGIFQGAPSINTLNLLANPITMIERNFLYSMSSLRNFNVTYKGKEYDSIQALRKKLLQEQR